MKRKKRAKSGPKPVAIEPAENPRDEEPTMEGVGEHVPNETIKVPECKFPRLDFPKILFRHSEFNYHLVHNKNTLVRLPCQPNVVTLLENYLKYLARNNFGDERLNGKNICRYGLEKRFKMCVEVLNGLRISFNTLLVLRLLINEIEDLQYEEAVKMTLQPPVNNIQQNFKQENGNVPNRKELENQFHENKDSARGKRENLRSSISRYAQSQNTCSDCSLTKSQCSNVEKEMFEKVRDEYVSKADEWKAVPDSAYNDKIKQPAIVYGVYHLLRFLDKLPEVLALIKWQGEKLSIVYLYCNGLLNYLSTQTRLFGPHNYL